MTQIATVELPIRARGQAAPKGLELVGELVFPDAERWGLTLWANGLLLEVRAEDGQAFVLHVSDVAIAMARAVAAYLSWAEAAQAAARGIVGRP